MERTKGSRILNALGVALCVVLLPLLVVNITLIAKSFISPDKVPDFMGYKPFIVLSGSIQTIHWRYSVCRDNGQPDRCR